MLQVFSSFASFFSQFTNILDWDKQLSSSNTHYFWFNSINNQWTTTVSVVLKGLCIIKFRQIKWYILGTSSRRCSRQTFLYFFHSVQLKTKDIIYKTNKFLKGGEKKAVQIGSSGPREHMVMNSLGFLFDSYISHSVLWLERSASHKRQWEVTKNK